jgi:hypothetical protein
VDETLRTLQRLASQGDERALRALERARIRLGRGWFDEELPQGLRTAATRPLYLWTPPKGYAIELVRVPDAECWISRRPISGLLYRTFSQTSGVPVRRPAVVEFESARAYAAWSGLTLARIAEWRAAREANVIDDAGQEWLATFAGIGAVIRRQPVWPDHATFRVVKRAYESR